MREYLLCLLAAAAVTYLLTPPVRRLALRFGFMAEVRDRDVHDEPTPRLGGLAMVGGIVAGLLLATRSGPGAGLPQQVIAPVSVSAQLWRSPVATSVKVPGGGVDCPAESSPQQASSPSDVSAHVWFRPALTAT